MTHYPSCHPEGCKECPLGKQEGVRVVHSILPEHAKVLFVGEAPGEVENEKGIPFVGKAGELLSQIMIEVGITRDDIAIVNTVACRPPDNRIPTTKEIKACSQFLHLEIASLKPALIVPLGAIALKAIYPSLGTITKVRGEFVDHPELNCKILPAFHPSYILRNPTERHFLVDALQKVSDFMHGKINIPEKQPTYYHTISNRKQLDWAVAQLHKNPLWACDTETTSVNQLEAEIFIITFSWKSHSAVLMDSRLFENDLEYFWAKVKEVMENNSYKIFHNGGYDIQCFINHDIQVQKYYADTMLMYYLLTQTILPGLDKLAWDFSDLGGYDSLLERYKKENTINSYKDIPTEIIYPYACADADVTLRSYLAMIPQIEAQKLSFVLFDIMIPTQKILLRAEYNGVSIDKNYLDKTIEKYTRKMQDQLNVVKNVPQVRQFVEDKRTEEKAILKAKWEKSKTLTKKYPTFEDYLQARLLKSPDSLTTEFNMNSPKQLKELLIDKMGLKVIKTTATGQPSVDGEVLEAYAKHNSFCNALQEYRTLSHLRSTFLVGIQNRLTSQNKVHTDYFLCTTDTGRPSSRDPNLANIPRTGTADDIKDIFCSDPGDWLMEADLAQAEFRIWMHYSKDPQALEDLNNGLDIHKLIAAVAYHNIKLPRGTITREVFLELTKDVSKDERQDTKTIVFGVMYGRGAPSVAAQLGISTSKAQKIIDVFFNRYPQASFWIKTTIATTRRDGYTVNLFGRKRKLPDILSPNQGVRAAAERQAINAPIQSGASDLTFLAGGRIFKHIWQNRMKSRLVLTVYDSLVFNIPDNELKAMVDLVSVEMIKKPLNSIMVPIGCEIKIGTHWGTLIEINPKEDWNIVYNKLIEHKKLKDVKFI